MRTMPTPLTGDTRFMQTNHQHHDNDADYEALLDVCVEMVEAQRGQPIEPGQGWTNDRQALAKKLIYHLSTIRSLRMGSALFAGGQEHRFIDHGSVIILVRAVVENFIVFAWIFGGESSEIAKFRHSVWRYAGLRDRLERQAITKEARAVQAREGPDAERLLTDIKAHPAFKALSNGQQKAITGRSDWKLGKPWGELAVEVGLSAGYFRAVYSYLCDYSHTSYAATLQIAQADVEAQSSMAKSMMGVANLCMAHFATIYAALFVSAQELLDASSSKLIVGKWNSTTAGMNEIYGKNI
ncbi:hypothetical protein PMI15_01990 [Polaromonas sp. CF318]|uniref:DUF5677 domain-containing protein n=1 Tax=Polaromonas sp. CF318 TaxID=1144318 RepID=UPI000271011D|nr:DUF5677 domain-containing protein [Polaromonas sp. CF318]EJL84877.1 hypothetical protein PMI15_01990 [Polaromonas sp. CF318]